MMTLGLAVRLSPASDETDKPISNKTARDVVRMNVRFTVVVPSVYGKTKGGSAARI